MLGYLSDRLDGWRVARAVGVKAELGFAYSGLHQICSTMLDELKRLPGPQREALGTVFGLTSGPVPNRFLVGLATLTLVAEVAEQQPLVCIVDDAHWLDQESEQILSFVRSRTPSCARSGTWESSTERVPMTPAIAARLGAEPGDPAIRTTDTFYGDSHPMTLSVSWEPAALTMGTAIMLPEEGPHAGKGVVERMAVIGQRITHAEETVAARPALATEAERLGIRPGGTVLTTAATITPGKPTATMPGSVGWHEDHPGGGAPRLRR